MSLERIASALERIAHSLEAANEAGKLLSLFTPSVVFDYEYTANDCGCEEGTVCGNTACPRRKGDVTCLSET